MVYSERNIQKGRIQGIVTDGNRDACCCFTGHRDIGRNEYEKIAEYVGKLTRTLYQTGVRHFFAGGAVGFDLIAAVTVLNLRRELPGLTLTLALPCRNHTARWGVTDRALMERVTAFADSVVYVSEAYTPGCMQKRNRYMVDRSGVCVCYYRGVAGGTRNTVLYAEQKGLTVHNLYFPETGEGRNR